MKYRSFLHLGLTLGLIGCLLVACSQDPNVRKQKYFQAGQLYFERNKYSEAAAEFLNAPKTNAAYERFESSLLVAFDSMKQIPMSEAE